MFPEKQRGQVHFLAREAAWPIAVPTRWTKAINCPQTPGEWDAVRRSVLRGAPNGSEPGQPHGRSPGLAVIVAVAWEATADHDDMGEMKYIT
jgi:hypothetical protein